MIAKDAKLSIQKIPLECLQVKEHQERYFGRLAHYVDLMLEHREMHPGLIYVTPSDTHKGMFAILDGHHRYCAHVMTGRDEALCVVVGEPLQGGTK